jgi:putative flippase GtrA
MGRSAQLGEFVRFAVAGSIGFCVDLVVLLTLVDVFNVAPLPAKAGAFAVALPTTWLINRAWTFRRSTGARKLSLREFMAYLAIQLTGASFNFATFAGCLMALPFSGDPALIVASAAGVVAGMSINFAGNKWIVFRRRGAHTPAVQEMTASSPPPVARPSPERVSVD